MYKKTIYEFNSNLASKDAVPGGGSASALAGALSASLANMAIELTYGKKKYLEYEGQLRKISIELKDLSEKLLEAINDDCKAFYPLSRCYSMDKSDSEYMIKLEKCLQDAAIPPLSIMKYSARVIELDSILKDITSKIMVSDVGTSVSLALGTLRGAYLNVLVNTKLMKDKEYATNLEQLSEKMLVKYSALANQTYNDVLERL